LFFFSFFFRPVLKSRFAARGLLVIQYFQELAENPSVRYFESISVIFSGYTFHQVTKQDRVFCVMEIHQAEDEHKVLSIGSYASQP